MEWLQQEWVKNLITLGSVIAAILAWVAKLRWSKEYTDAKDAVISAKDDQIKTKQSHIEFLDRQIDALKEQTPEKLREHYKSIQQGLEEFNEKQKKQLSELKLELKERDSKLEGASERENSLREEIKLKEDQIQRVRSELAQTQVLQASAKRLASITLDLGQDAFQERMDKYADLGEYIDHEDRFSPHPEEPTLENLVEWFLENYKDPVHGVPWVDGEYYYVYGGPYHSDEELFEHFPDVDENIIIAASEKIDSDGTIDWVKQWQY